MISVYCPHCIVAPNFAALGPPDFGWWPSCLIYFTFRLLWNWGGLDPVQFSCSAMNNSLWPHGLQLLRLPCASPTPGACSNSCPSNRWCHPTISSSVIPFSSCLQSFPSSGSFQMSHLLETIARMCWRQDLADLYLTKGKQNSPL